MWPNRRLCRVGGGSWRLPLGEPGDALARAFRANCVLRVCAWWIAGCPRPVAARQGAHNSHDRGGQPEDALQRKNVRVWERCAQPHFHPNFGPGSFQTSFHTVFIPAVIPMGRFPGWAPPGLPQGVLSLVKSLGTILGWPLTPAGFSGDVGRPCARPVFIPVVTPLLSYPSFHTPFSKVGHCTPSSVTLPYARTGVVSGSSAGR